MTTLKVILENGTVFQRRTVCGSTYELANSLKCEYFQGFFNMDALLEAIPASEIEAIVVNNCRFEIRRM